MRNRPFLLLLAGTLACSGPTLETDGTVQPAADEYVHGAGTITPTDMHARVAFLASDALRGRDTPSHGLEVAAEYIASEFARMGLEPRGDSGTFLQRYPFTRRTLRSDAAALRVSVSGTPTAIAFGSEMFVWPGTTPGAERALVFVGTALSDSATALREQIPVVFAAGALDRTWRSTVVRARNAARTMGASALMVILDPAITREEIRQRASISTVATGLVPAPTLVFVRYDVASQLFKRAGHDLAALVARAQTGKFAPVALPEVRAQLTAPVAEVVDRPPNVVAVLPGSDPELRNTYVVISAHMDHIGVGRPDARGDSINNGADDDASGTSAVLEIAEALASLQKRPARSILFLAVSGEEKGLLGSQYFVDYPVVPLTSMVANVNLDMISRNAPDTIVAIGQDYSSLGPLTQAVVAAHPELGLTVARDIWPQERFFFRSDHYNFARKEIPAIFFFAGVHEDYHRPSDHVEKIDADKAARVARLAYYLVLEIANRRDAPSWTPQGLNEVRQLTR